MNGVLIDQQPAYDNMLNVEVAIQLDEKFVSGQVKQKALVPEGKIVGRYHANTMLNHIIYEVELPDI